MLHYLALPLLEVRGGDWFCLNLLCHALCKWMGGLYLSEWRWRSSGWGGVEGKVGMGGEEGGQAGWYVQ